jgi:hypothetical protein
MKKQYVYQHPLSSKFERFCFYSFTKIQTFCFDFHVILICEKRIVDDITAVQTDPKINKIQRQSNALQQNSNLTILE